MPPKRAAALQAIRDAFPEERSAQIIERWANDAVPKLDAYAQAVSKLRSGITAASPSSTPSEIVKALQDYQNMCHEVYSEAEAIRTVISTRVPEYKEEDNLGVAVQMSVLKMLEGVVARVLGGGEDKGASLSTNMFALKSYLSARAAVEDKLLGKPATGSDEEAKKESGGSQAPSAKLELLQTDIDTLIKAEMAATRLATELRVFVNAYTLNWKKLIQPRVSNDRMVS